MSRSYNLAHVLGIGATIISGLAAFYFGGKQVMKNSEFFMNYEVERVNAVYEDRKIEIPDTEFNSHIDGIAKGG